jgi:hypothetical protein
MKSSIDGLKHKTTPFVLTVSSSFIDPIIVAFIGKILDRTVYKVCDVGQVGENVVSLVTGNLKPALAGLFILAITN